MIQRAHRDGFEIKKKAAAIVGLLIAVRLRYPQRHHFQNAAAAGSYRMRADEFALTGALYSLKESQP